MHWFSKEMAGIVFLWAVVAFAVAMMTVVVVASILLVVGAFG